MLIDIWKLLWMKWNTFLSSLARFKQFIFSSTFNCLFYLKLNENIIAHYIKYILSSVNAKGLGLVLSRTKNFIGTRSAERHLLAMMRWTLYIISKSL